MRSQSSSHRRLASFALNALVLVVWLTMMMSFVFFLFLAGHSPTSPDPSSGRVAQMNNHGHLFYVRPWEQRIFEYGPTACFVTIAGVVLVQRSLKLQEPAQSSGVMRPLTLLGFASLFGYLLCRYLLRVGDW